MPPTSNHGPISHHHSPRRPSTKHQAIAISTAIRLPPLQPTVKPTPWQWKCPSCKIVYSLGVTQRCLTCPIRAHPRPGRRARQRRAPKMQFDFDGWMRYGEWRRDRAAFDADPRGWVRDAIRSLRAVDRLSARDVAVAATSKEYRGRLVEMARKARLNDARDQRLKSGTHDCSVDCDSPSECRHLYLETQEALAREEKASLPQSPRSPPAEDWEEEYYLEIGPSDALSRDIRLPTPEPDERCAPLEQSTETAQGGSTEVQ